MAETPKLIGYVGLYDNVGDAEADFSSLKDAQKADMLGMYDAALFEKTAEGKVKVLNTDATQRGEGAKVGAIAGGILGVLFPPTILVSAGVGAAIGAGYGNLMKGFMNGDVKAAAEALAPGEAGVMLAADESDEIDADRLLQRAKKVAKQRIDASVEEIAAAGEE